jgi:molybdopterin biosynthesis enzyme MoaB
LPIVVVLPLPLTPTTRMTCGFSALLRTSGLATGSSSRVTSRATASLISSGLIS